MLSLPHLLVFFSFLSSGLACIPTVTPDDMYEEEMGTTSVLMTMTQEMTSTSSAAASSSSSTATGTSTMSTSSTTSTSTTTTTTTNPYICPSGMWVLNSITGRCYMVRTAPLEWVAAEGDCNSFSATLVGFENQEENDYVYNSVVLPTMPASNSFYWLGLIQGGNTMVFSTMTNWVDGDSYNYAVWSNWYPPGPPAMTMNGFCAAMVVEEMMGNDGTWGSDESCDALYPYICEIAAIVIG